MILWLDAHISPKLVPWIHDTFGTDVQPQANSFPKRPDPEQHRCPAFWVRAALVIDAAEANMQRRHEVKQAD